MNSGLPALFGVKANTGKAFESEREILYQVLFDMRRDVTDLKKLVNTLMAERGAQSVPTAPATTAVSYYQEPQRNLVATVAVSYTHLRAHETGRNLVCRLLLEKKKNY